MDTYNRFDKDVWVLSDPSRRLKKVYAALALVEQQIEETRHTNWWPDHAPTAFRMMRARLRPLEAERYRLMSRILRLNGDD